MGKTAKYIILAEDVAGARFVEGWLRSRGVNASRDSRAVLKDQRDRGSGKQWVTKQYPVEVRVFRAKRNHVEKALLVATDADELSVRERHRQLALSLERAKLDARAAEEAIALVIPKWEIETWAEHLLDEVPVTEDEKSGWTSDRSETDCPEAGERLHEHRRPRPTCCPPSLVASDDEFARVPVP